MGRGKRRNEAPTFSLPSHRPSRAYFLNFLFILLEKIVFALVVSFYANFLEQKKAISREKVQSPAWFFQYTNMAAAVSLFYTPI